MAERTDLERAILARAYANPDESHEEVARAVNSTTDRVAEVLDAHAGDEVVEAVVETNWDDPERCPFCGTQLADPGQGFIDHVDEKPDCKASFEAWRSHIAGDIGGEWSG